MKKIKILIASSIALLLFITTSFAVSTSPLAISCKDSVAGLDSSFSLKTLKNTEVQFLLVSPSEKRIYMSEVSDSSGYIKSSITSFHTQKSGTYRLSAKFADRTEEFGKECVFKVYPAEFSAIKSKIEVTDKTVEANGYDEARIKVIAYDKFENPLKGHSIKLISSRKDDEIKITSQLPYTDEIGEIEFSITSNTPGLAFISAVNLTEEIDIVEKAQIGFVEKSDYELSIGGNDSSYFEDPSIFLSSTLAGQIYEFEIDIPDEVKTNESISPVITAVDELGNIVPNYTGKIRFSSTDENAILPDDYQFTVDDLGVHEFKLGAVFKSDGSHILSVNDIANPVLKGEVEVTPIKEATSTSIVKTSLTIQSPMSGTYGQRNIDFKGSTSANTLVVALEGDNEMAQVQSNQNGEFQGILNNLDDGTHSISFEARDKNENSLASSDPIEIIVDATPPEIVNFTVTPSENIKQGDMVKLSLTSEEDLSETTAFIGPQKISLKPVIEEQSLYAAETTLNAEPGLHKVSLILKDSLGNETSVSDYMEVEIMDPSTPPSKVEEIVTKASDAKVTLSWASSNDDTYVVKYKIKYGAEADKLYLEAVTFDSSTTWYIPNLTNNTEYFFTVQAIDSDGNESEPSEVISAIPMITTDEFANLGDPIILKELPEETPETGPEIWIIALSTLLFIDIYFRIRLKN